MIAVLLACMLGTLACVQSTGVENPTVRQAVTERYNEPPRKNTAATNPSEEKPTNHKRPAPTTDELLTKSAVKERSASRGGPIATLNGHAISRDRVVQMLLAVHGANVLEQLVVLEEAKQRAADMGLNVTDTDIQAEYDRRLARILSTLEPGGTNPEFDRDEAERLLTGILTRRNISRTEYLSSVKQNAYLRAIAYAEMRFSNADLEREYQANFAERVEVRHIQLSNQTDAERVRLMLDNGLDFAAAAAHHSTNLRTGPSGGLLAAFSRTDQGVPQALREAAFALEEGQVSAPVRVDGWYHIVKLEKKLVSGDTGWQVHQVALEHRLREQRADPQMQALYRSLLDGADVKIIDPVLAKQYAGRRENRRN